MGLVSSLIFKLLVFFAKIVQDLKYYGRKWENNRITDG